MAPKKLGGGGAAIFLHLNQFLLCVVTIVGLHITGNLWDLDRTIERLPNSGEKKNWGEIYMRQHPEGQPKWTPPEHVTYWTGALWAVVVGLLGMIAGLILIGSFVIELPTKFVRWYYLAAALLILFVASLGLGVNQEVTDYDKCMKDRADSRKINPNYGKNDPSDAAICMGKYGILAFRFFIYGFSCIHAMLYVASFLMAFCDNSACPHSAGGNYSAAPPPQQSPIVPMNAEVRSSVQPIQEAA